jgi:hypothetical protein
MGPLRVVVHIGRCPKVGVIREVSEDGGGRCAGYCTRVHLTEHHASGFDETERGMDGKKFAGGTGF